MQQIIKEKEIWIQIRDYCIGLCITILLVKAFSLIYIQETCSSEFSIGQSTSFDMILNVP